MITKIYKQPEIEIYKFSAESGFASSKELEPGNADDFGYKEDLGEWVD